MQQYNYGRSKEELVARILRGHGAHVELSPGSRGAFDLKAEFPGGVVWVVSVKATRTPPPRIPSEKELTRLKISAGLRGATPVVALVVADSVEFFSVRAGRRIIPPRAS